MGTFDEESSTYTDGTPPQYSTVSAMGDVTTTGGSSGPSRNDLQETVLSGICVAILVYLTICQIVVFLFRSKTREISFRLRKWKEIFAATNLPYLMSLVVVFSAIIGTCYVIMSTVNRYVPFYRPLYSALVCCLMLSFLAMYLVLWLRQTSFYTEPSINHLTHPVARYVSLFHGFFIVAGAVAFTVIQVVAVYKPSCVRPGCIARWVSMVITASQLEVQIALLVLFVCPLIKHRQNLENVSSRERNKHNSLMGLIKRAVVVTAVSIFIDVASIGLYLSLKTGTVYNVATVLNLLCTIFCFGDYKARLMPCFIARQAQERRASQSSMRTQERSLSKGETAQLKSDVV